MTKNVYTLEAIDGRGTIVQNREVEAYTQNKAMVQFFSELPMLMASSLDRVICTPNVGGRSTHYSIRQQIAHLIEALCPSKKARHNFIAQRIFIDSPHDLSLEDAVDMSEHAELINSEDYVDHMHKWFCDKFEISEENMCLHYVDWKRVSDLFEEDFTVLHIQEKAGCPFTNGKESLIIIK